MGLLFDYRDWDEVLRSVHYLFSKRGYDALARLLHSGADFFAFDFDGTLTRIVRRPTDALLPEPTRRMLEELSRRAHLAIVSGRSMESLSSLIAIPGVWLVGNHGIEGMQWPPEFMSELQQTAQQWAKSLHEIAWAGPQTGSCELENKVYTLSLHYRLASQPDLARLEILKSIQKLQPQPRAISGKSVINLVPQKAPNKGVALLKMMKTLKTSTALYVGDDWTDEDVFRLNDPGILSVKIGLELGSQAQFYLEAQTETDQLIRYLLRQTERELPLAGT